MRGLNSQFIKDLINDWHDWASQASGNVDGCCAELVSSLLAMPGREEGRLQPW